MNKILKKLKELFNKIKEVIKKLYGKRDVVKEEEKPITPPKDASTEKPITIFTPAPSTETSPQPETKEEVVAREIPSLFVIQSFMKSLDNTEKKGFDAVDEALNYASEGEFENLEQLVESYSRDCLENSGSTTTERKAFLKKYCGIDLDNEDTGSATGYDAGGEEVKTKESIVKEDENLKLEDIVYDYSKFKKISALDVSGIVLYKNINYKEPKEFYGYKVNNVTLYWSEADWENLNIDIEICKKIIVCIINVWSKEAFSLIKDSYGMTLGGTESTLQRLEDGTCGLQLILTNDLNSSSIASVGSARFYNYLNPIITECTYAVMNVNMRYYKTGIIDVNGRPQNTNSNYLDRVIAHELVHAVMAANINSFINLPKFIKEGLAELVHGIDDDRKASILSFVNTNYSGTVTSNGESIKIGLEELIKKTLSTTSTSASYSTYTYAGGYILLRYFMKQTALKLKNKESE